MLKLVSLSFTGGIREDDDNIFYKTNFHLTAEEIKKKPFGPTKMISTLATTPVWIFLAWIAFVFLCSPLLFIISVVLPEIPLMIMRRICYVPRIET